MSQHILELNMTKEATIHRLAQNLTDCVIEYHFRMDVSSAQNVYEAKSMACDIDFGMPDFEEEAKEKYKAFEKKKKELNELPFHEVLELGEKEGLWKLKEKQKRLVE